MSCGVCSTNSSEPRHCAAVERDARKQEPIGFLVHTSN